MTVSVAGTERREGGGGRGQLSALLPSREGPQFNLFDVSNGFVTEHPLLPLRPAFAWQHMIRSMSTHTQSHTHSNTQSHTQSYSSFWLLLFCAPNPQNFRLDKSRKVREWRGKGRRWKPPRTRCVWVMSHSVCACACACVCVPVYVCLILQLVMKSLA